MSDIDRVPSEDAKFNWGTALRRWLLGAFVNLRVTGDLTDGTNTTTVAALKAGISWKYLFTGSAFSPFGIADGAVTTAATIEVDPLNAALSCVAFNDTTSEGIFLGDEIAIPTGATNLTINATWAARTSPGSSKGVRMKLFSRVFSSGSALGAWDDGTLLTAWTTTDATRRLTSETITLSTLDWTEDTKVQLQIARIPADESDDLVADALLTAIELVFS